MRNDSLDSLLRRVRINPFANFGDISDRQREVLNAISQLIANNQHISEDSISLRISDDIDMKACFWSLWHKKILITNNSHQRAL